MKFVLVNGRTPNPPSFCALCCVSIGERYLRELAVHALQKRARASYDQRRSRYPPEPPKASVMRYTVMRYTQAPRHQVRDYCGGRFGLVTHRWWGNKFCIAMSSSCSARSINTSHHIEETNHVYTNDSHQWNQASAGINDDFRTLAIG
jgi:hypothetical protein